MLSDLSVGERSGRVIVRSGKGNEARTVPLNASARLALAVYLAPQWEFVEKKYRDPIYTQRSAHFAVIWYVVVRPKRLPIVCSEQSLPHSGEVSNATPYLHSKELGGQEHGGTKPVEAPAPGARGPGSEAVHGETCIG